jgi:hypothetical protein
MAIAIVGLALVPLYALEMQMITRIMRSVANVERIYAMYDFFVTSQRPTNELNEKIEKRIEDPALALTMTGDKKSSVQKTFDDMQIATIEWAWTTGGKKMSDECVVMHFVPPKPKTSKEDGKESATSKSAPQQGGKG